MTELKLRQLLAAARRQTPPLLAGGVDGRVDAAIRREPARETESLFHQLDRLFPRMATAVAVVVGLCLAAEAASALIPGPGLSDGVARLSQEWLFAAKGD